ncbi:MAG TPA: hypothetical protein VKS78_05655, partial [Roseiarcus sp.]|nr:hypothetical protein [Roseiarcus sp.]
KRISSGRSAASDAGACMTPSANHSRAASHVTPKTTGMSRRSRRENGERVFGECHAFLDNSKGPPAWRIALAEIERDHFLLSDENLINVQRLERD